MKYVELHCHLDGSLDIETSFLLAKKRKLIPDDTSIDDFRYMMQVKDDNKSLEEYLKRFDMPISILQDKEALSISTYAVIKNLVADNVVYAELRFASSFFTHNGLTQEEAILAILDGYNKASKDFPSVKVQFILCLITSTDVSKNDVSYRETIELAHKYKDKGVCAIDLAGAEGLSPMSSYKPYFDLAKYYNIPYTIHAGEAKGAKEVLGAINLGAKRIGHGCHCIEDKDVTKLVIDKKIPLEVCPTSNIQCCNQKSYKEHNVISLYHQCATITFNTDNRTMSHTTMEKEAEHLINDCGFSEDDLKKMMINAVDGAFISQEEKDKLKKIIAND